MEQQPSTMGNLQNSASNAYNSAAESASNAYNSAAESASSLYNNAAESLSEPLASASNSMSGIQDSFNNTMNEFSSKSVGQASSEFLSSNSLIARFAFVFLVVIFFMIFLRLGIYLVSYFMQPSNNPYLISGMIAGSTALQIKQDPKDSSAVTLLRSNNATTGIEFTWSIWLYITDLSGGDQSQPTYQHIFNKGDNTYNSTGVASINNAPGLYLLNSNVPTLHVVMNSVSTDKTIESMDIDNLPLKKWFHVALRMQNKNMDVYINGIITGRVTFTNVPKQNYQDVFICQNGGFSGSLSNLRYYDYALNIFDINTIVLTGPNTTPSTVSAEFDSSSTSGYTYLSSLWYTNKM